MFNPDIISIGEATDLWKGVSRHRVVVALAIFNLVYREQVFSPTPVELGRACRRARAHLSNQLSHMNAVLDDLSSAEEIMFDFARDDWASSYANGYAEGTTLAVSKRFYDHAEHFKAWSDAIDAIEHAKNHNLIRAIMDRNISQVETVSSPCVLHEGMSVPHGIAPPPLPRELLEAFPWLGECQCFVTTSQIALVMDGKVVEIIERFVSLSQ